MASARYRWPCLVAALFAALANGAYAANSEYTKVQTAFKDPSGGRTVYGSFIAKTKVNTLPAVYNNVNLPASARTVGKMARGALGGPIGAALTAAALLDDLIAQKNPQTGDWELVKPPEPFSDCPAGTGGYSYCQAVPQGLRDVAHTCVSTSTQGVQTVWGSAPVPYGSSYTSVAPAGADWVGNCGAYAIYRMPAGLSEPTTTPATDSEIYDALSDHMNMQDWRDLMEWFALNRKQDYLNDNLSELKQALDQIANAHQQAADNNLTLDTDIEIVTNSSTENINNYNTELTEIQKLLNQIVNNNTNITVEMDASKIDIPTDCDFHPTICAFIDWFKTTEPLPEHPDLPVEDIGPETFNSGLGSGSCPAPVQFSFHGQSMEYSYQPACDAAPWFKAILITIAGIAAAYILLGVRQNA